MGAQSNGFIPIEKKKKKTTVNDKNIYQEPDSPFLRFLISYDYSTPLLVVLLYAVSPTVKPNPEIVSGEF